MQLKAIWEVNLYNTKLTFQWYGYDILIVLSNDTKQTKNCVFVKQDQIFQFVTKCNRWYTFHFSLDMFISTYW